MTPSVRIPISLALAGLEAARLGIAAGRPNDRAAEVKGLIEWAGRTGFRAVQLNAATPGVRARDLDRSARRDLAAMLRRSDLMLSGLDLWIPPEHFAAAEHVDRAVASLIGAIDLSADLGSLAASSVVSSRPRPMPVSVVLPEKLAADIESTIVERARARGVRIADHAWPARAVSPESEDVLGCGVDPAVVLDAGEDPATVAARLGARLVSARLSDLARGMGLSGRLAPGSGRGRLDLDGYVITLATISYPGAMVVDLRGVQEQAAAAQDVVEALGPER